MTTPVRFEACVGSLEQALAAQEDGADRIELCAGLEVGGTTPALADVRAARQALRIPIQVMVRPRGGSFVHTPAELRAMQDSLDQLKEAGVDGAVFGVLRPDQALDLETMRELVARARPLSVTCHRAFDQTPDLMGALDQLIALGVDRVLTSGGKATAWEGRATLRDLVARSAGRITILAGGGIRAHNWRALVAETGVREIHAAARIQVHGG